MVQACLHDLHRYLLVELDQPRRAEETLVVRGDLVVLVASPAVELAVVFMLRGRIPHVAMVVLPAVQIRVVRMFRATF
jgi:hypothetical protein